MERAEASTEAIGFGSSLSEIATANAAVSPNTHESESVRDLLMFFEDPPSDLSAQTDASDTELNATSSADRPLQPWTDMERLNTPVSDAEVGTRFVSWLRESIQSHRLVINDAKALVHTVNGTAFLVSPGAFQRFIQEHPETAQLAKKKKITVPDWAWAQKQFEKLRLHRKQHNGLNIWVCEVAGARRTRRLNGYLLLDGHTLFSDLPSDNPYLKLVISTPAPRRDAA